MLVKTKLAYPELDNRIKAIEKEAALKKAIKELEIRVKDRTAKLAAINRRLQEEIEEHK